MIQDYSELTVDQRVNISSKVLAIYNDEGLECVENFYYAPESFKVHAFARAYLTTLVTGGIVPQVKTFGRGGRRSGSGRKPSPGTEKRKAFSVSIPESLFERIEKFCSDRDCSLNQYIIDSVKMRLNK